MKPMQDKIFTDRIFNRTLLYIAIIIALTFIIGIYSGHYASSDLKRESFKYLEQTINENIQDREGIELVWAIFKNNFFVTLTILALSITLVLPIAIIFTNGVVIGVINFAVQRILSLLDIEDGLLTFKGIIVHGIPELIAILFSAALSVFLGIKLWQFLFRMISIYFQKKYSLRAGYYINNARKDVFDTLFALVRLIVIVIIPFLAIAAVLETYVTPTILEDSLNQAASIKDYEKLFLDKDIGNIMGYAQDSADNSIFAHIEKDVCTMTENKDSDRNSSANIMSSVLDDRDYEFIKCYFAEEKDDSNYSADKQIHYTDENNITLVYQYRMSEFNSNCGLNFTLENAQEIFRSEIYYDDKADANCSMINEYIFECNTTRINVKKIFCSN